jgi:hypothetical protein
VLEIAPRPPADEYVGTFGEVIGNRLIPLERMDFQPVDDAGARERPFIVLRVIRPDHTDGLAHRRFLGY